MAKRPQKFEKGGPASGPLNLCLGAGDNRHIKTFERKKDADAWHAEASVSISAGTHIAPSKAPTVKAAGYDWLEACEAEKLERATLKGYEERLRKHIIPFIGDMKVCDVSVPVVSAFRDKLRKSGRSAHLTKATISSLGAILSDAQRRGSAVRNAVKEMPRRKRSDRHERKLKVGVDIPSPAEISDIIGVAKRHWRPLLITAAFTGLSAM